MPRFRKEKERLLALCLSADWKRLLEERVASGAGPKEVVNPLLALLSRPECRWQAAYGLGLAVPRMARENPESARVLMRRLMWSLNEESGNLGWGVPEAMACILAGSPALAGEYARIFLSYGYETGKDDNFLDYAPLRRGVIWGMGELARGGALPAAPALPHLVRALSDEDGPIRALAAWSLAQLRAAAAAAPEPEQEGWREARQKLKAALEREKALPGLSVEYFDGRDIVRQSSVEMMAAALAALE